MSSFQRCVSLKNHRSRLPSSAWQTKPACGPWAQSLEAGAGPNICARLGIHRRDTPTQEVSGLINTPLSRGMCVNPQASHLLPGSPTRPPSASASQELPRWVRLFRVSCVWLSSLLKEFFQFGKSSASSIHLGKTENNFFGRSTVGASPWYTHKVCGVMQIRE